MKKILFVFCALCAAVSAGAQEPFVIEGQVTGVPDGTVIEYWRFVDGNFQRVDSIVVVDGSFSYRASVPEKGNVELWNFPWERLGPLRLQLWAEPGQKAVVRGDDILKLPLWSVESTIPEQQEEEIYRQALKTEAEELLQNEIRMNEVRLLPIEERKQVGDRLQNERTDIEYRIYDKTLDLLAAAEPSAIFLNKLSDIGFIVFYSPETFGKLKDRAIAQYERLTDEQKASESGRQIARRLFPPAQAKVGDPMVDAELADLSGVMHKLSEYTGRGKYILLDFWASWCTPCIMGFPEIREASEKYADQLTIVGINIDSAHKKWSEATEKHSVSWVNLCEPQGFDSELGIKYKIDGIPRQILVSPEGIIVDDWTGYREGLLQNHLEKYIHD
jgi:thiol-disulfide isomerase/thioredoxin